RLEPTHAERYEATPEEIEKFGLRRFQPQGTIFLYRPRPSALTPTGYLGRTTIMEFLVMDDALRRAVMRHAGMGELEQLAREAGMAHMDEDGIAKALAGEPPIEEVLRVTEDAGGDGAVPLQGAERARRSDRGPDGRRRCRRSGAAPAGTGPPAG